MKSRTVARLHRQRGVAAIEMALIAMALLLMFYSVAAFSLAFYTQQALEHAAADGARAALMFSEDLAPDDQRVRSAVYDSLRSTPIPLPPSADPNWFRLVLAGRAATVTLTYPYASLAFFPAPLGTPWLPQQLSSQATASLPL